MAKLKDKKIVKTIGKSLAKAGMAEFDKTAKKYFDSPSLSQEHEPIKSLPRISMPLAETPEIKDRESLKDLVNREKTIQREKSKSDTTKSKGSIGNLY